MELLQLKYFQSVAKYENITRAANELHISQPSLSITIKRLEDELQVPLFNRKGKKIELNIFGKSFLKNVNSILNQIETSKLELLEASGEKNTHLSLSASISFFLSGLLKDFLLVNPDITMSQSINSISEIITKLNDRSLDFAITCPPIENPNIETMDLIEEEIVAVIPITHPLARKKSIFLNELKNEDFISLTEDNSFKNITNKMFENAKFEPNVTFEGDAYILSELIEIKQAVALVPLSVCLKSDKTSFTLLRLEDKLKTRKIAISYKKGILLSDLSQTFLNFAIDYYKNHWYVLKNSPNKHVRYVFKTSK
ncbi:LysR family transcriptional regulator [uncultured Clostridium sp.]|uniref:LysR family transcriptional regulator n=1 Tax=uncultured Clostridium sp. TaxID=59620 RepID=UPI002611E5F3|nr:LysR family transcriptional regulator [uncultured Clostridium sp.]